MKFSTIVLALATIVAAAPSATAEYVCHTEAIFTYASDASPSVSIKAQEFLGSVMVDTFNEAYATQVIKDDANFGNTRGARKLRHGSSGGGRCGPLCDNDDDSRMLSSEVSPAGDRKLWTNASHGSGGFSVEFGSLKEHVAWEKLVLENGRTHTELAGLKDCKIVLSDCHIE